MRRVSREDGVAATEFALILPVLALLLFGTIEFGRVLSQYQVYQGAAREGARCAAVASTSDCVIQDEIDQAATPYDPEKDAAIEVLEGGGSRPDGCLETDRGQDVQVSWEQPLDVNIPFWRAMTITSSIKAVFRCE
ncbi:MAG: TadE/TadG family type IV pilus assembly protein [Actinomycetota bacterium]